MSSSSSSSSNVDEQFNIAINLLKRDNLPESIVIHNIMPFLTTDYIYPIHFVTAHHNQPILPSRFKVISIVRRQNVNSTQLVSRFVSILVKQDQEWINKPLEKRLNYEFFEEMVELCGAFANFEIWQSFSLLTTSGLILSSITMCQELLIFLYKLTHMWRYRCRFFGTTNDATINTHIFLPSPMYMYTNVYCEVVQFCDIHKYNFIAHFFVNQQYKSIYSLIKNGYINNIWLFDALIFTNTRFMNDSKFNIFMSILVKQSKSNELSNLFSYLIHVCKRELGRNTCFVRLPDSNMFNILHHHYIKYNTPNNTFFDGYNYLIKYAITCDNEQVLSLLTHYNKKFQVSFNNVSFFHYAIIKQSIKCLRLLVDFWKKGFIVLEYSEIVELQRKLICNNSNNETFIQISILDMGFRPTERWVIDQSIFTYVFDHIFNDKTIVYINNALKQLSKNASYKFDWLQVLVYFLHNLIKPSSYRTIVDMENVKNIAQAIIYCVKQSDNLLISYQYFSMVTSLLESAKFNAPFVRETATKSLWQQYIQEIETELSNSFIIDSTTLSKPSIKSKITQKQILNWIETNDYDQIKHAICVCLWYPESIRASNTVLECAIKMNHYRIVQLFMELLHLPMDSDFISSIYRNGHIETASYLSSITSFDLSSNNLNSIFCGTGYSTYQKSRNSNDISIRTRFFDTVMILLNGNELHKILAARLSVLNIMKAASMKKKSKKVLTEWLSNPTFIQWIHTGEIEVSKGNKRTIDTITNDNEMTAKRIKTN